MIHLGFKQALAGWKTLVTPCEETDDLNLTTDGSTVWVDGATGATTKAIKWSATLTRA